MDYKTIQKKIIIDNINKYGEFAGVRLYLLNKINKTDVSYPAFIATTALGIAGVSIATAVLTLQGNLEANFAGLPGICLTGATFISEISGTIYALIAKKAILINEIANSLKTKGVWIKNPDKKYPKLIANDVTTGFKLVDLVQEISDASKIASYYETNLLNLSNLSFKKMLDNYNQEITKQDNVKQISTHNIDLGL